MSLFKGMIEGCLDAMSEKETEELFRKIAGKVNPEVHLQILTEAFKQLSGDEKEEVRKILFGKEYLVLKEFLKEWKEIKEEYEKEKKEGLIGPL